MIEWLLKLSLVVEQTIIYPKWRLLSTHYIAPINNSIIKEKYVWINIKKDGFWDTCANFDDALPTP
jgi:hypothetical protein